MHGIISSWEKTLVKTIRAQLVKYPEKKKKGIPSKSTCHNTGIKILPRLKDNKNTVWSLPLYNFRWLKNSLEKAREKKNKWETL